MSRGGQGRRLSASAEGEAAGIVPASVPAILPVGIPEMRLWQGIAALLVVAFLLWRTRE